jgi:choline/glycine/proline betaine transport protein
MSPRDRKIAVNPPVFFTSGVLLLLFLGFGTLFRDTASVFFGNVLDFVSSRFGWFYVLSVAFFLVFTIWLVFSPYARIRLGEDDSRPEFGRPTWFAMLFSAGMGIGLLFYGVAEPMMHYVSPPEVAGKSEQAAKLAVPTALFHYGVHPWAVYVLMGLSIAYFGYRKKLPLSIRSAFYPLLGERIHGPVGHVIDILAVIGTLFGLATSLGVGAMQVGAGLEHLTGVANTTTTQLLLIGTITLAATISLVTGVKKGIRRLSELNMILAGLLLLFVLVVGPTMYVLNSLAENIGIYLSELAHRTFWMDTQGDGKWLRNWTIFYWGWWIAWSPFVGMFVARVSRGRTIREFILGVLLMPTAVSFVWFTVFGDTALWLEMQGAEIAAAVDADLATAIYVMLAELPLAALTSFFAAAVVAVFFVTSSDSASFVVDMITSGGDPNPPIWQRVFWASSEGAVAAVLIYAGGKTGLEALQSGVISIGLPFCALLLLMCFSLLKALREDRPARADLPLEAQMAMDHRVPGPVRLVRRAVREASARARAAPKKARDKGRGGKEHQRAAVDVPPAAGPPEPN